MKVYFNQIYKIITKTDCEQTEPKKIKYNYCTANCTHCISSPIEWMCSWICICKNCCGFLHRISWFVSSWYSRYTLRIRINQVCQIKKVFTPPCTSFPSLPLPPLLLSSPSSPSSPASSSFNLTPFSFSHSDYSYFLIVL